MSKIAIIEAGAFGTALACVLSETAKNQYETMEDSHEIYLYTHEQNTYWLMKNSRINGQYLNNITLKQNIIPSNNIERTVDNADFVFITVPAQFVRDTLSKIKPYLRDGCTVLFTSKGFDEDGSTMSEIAQKMLSGVKIVGIYGITFARLLVKKEILSFMTIASEDIDAAKNVAILFKNRMIRIHLSIDIRGAEIGGAMKNVYATFMGLYEGYMKSNCDEKNKEYKWIQASKYSMQSICVMEFIKFGLYQNAKLETMIGPSGIGDIYSCSNSLSRNFRYGEWHSLMQQGMTLDEAVDIREGYNTIKAALDLSSRLEIDMPILKATHDILFEGKDSRSVISHLRDSLVRDIEYDFSLKHELRCKNDVFICHADLDKPKIANMLSHFRESGIKYWIDNEQMDAGEIIPEGISNAISHSRYVIACISKNFGKSHWTHLEIANSIHIKMKLREKNRIIPVIIDENCEENIPPLIISAVRIHASKEEELDKLIKTLKKKCVKR